MKSCVETLFRRLKINQPFYGTVGMGECKYFGDICQGYSLLHDKKRPLSDDEFFQYFRSLAVM